MMKKSAKSTSILTAFIIAAFLLSILLLAGCLKMDDGRAAAKPEPKMEYNSSLQYEITKDDIFSKKDWTSRNIAVYGFKLGDTAADMIRKIGAPDLKTGYANWTNYEFKESLGMKNVGLLIRFDKEDKAISMTFKPPFNDKLQGETKIKHTKEDMYRIFGRPTNIQVLSYLTIYSYAGRGIDIIMDGKKENGFVLYTDEGQVFGKGKIDLIQKEE